MVGDGWGWSWFDAYKPLTTTSTNYKLDCQGCHVPAVHRLDLQQRVSHVAAVEHPHRRRAARSVRCVPEGQGD
jgi:hypothetical protein